MGWPCGALSLVAVLARALRSPRRPAARRPRRFPPGFQETVAFSGLTNPTAVRFAPGRARLRRREERPDQGLRQPRRPDADGRSPTCARNVHNFWDRGLLGHGARTRASRPIRTSTSSTRTTPRSAAPRRAGAPPGVTSDGCPTPPGPTGDGCVVSGRLSRLDGGRQRDDRARAGADRGLVPAVPEPLDRRARVRRRRRALRQRRRRRELQLRRLRARTAAR